MWTLCQKRLFLKVMKSKPANKLPSLASIHFQFLFDNIWTFLDIDSDSNLSRHLLLGKPYKWFYQDSSLNFFHYPFKPIIGLYSGILYWKNEDEEKHSKFPLFTSTGQNDANIHDVTLLCIVTFVISTGVYLLIFSCSLCKWSCIANTQE